MKTKQENSNHLNTEKKPESVSEPVSSSGPAAKQQGFTVILKSGFNAGKEGYHDTPLHFSVSDNAGIRRVTADGTAAGRAAADDTGINKAAADRNAAGRAAADKNTAGKAVVNKAPSENGLLNPAPIDIIMEELMSDRPAGTYFGSTALPSENAGGYSGNMALPSENTGGYSGSAALPFKYTGGSSGNTVLPYKDTSFPSDPVPEKIRMMRRLYKYGNGSFREKCRNFYVQGKFMEDYEDDFPWRGNIHKYFLVYHDLRPDQLRGYFSWRTKVRKGVFESISTSAAYIYVYELLNGIGAASVTDSLKKLKDFETGYLDSEIGDPTMRRNIRRWMKELAILNNLSPEEVQLYADPDVLSTDRDLEILHDPEACSDAQIFEALLNISESKTASSVVVQKFGEESIRLFSQVWKTALSEYGHGNKDLFSECFGSLCKTRWYPLGNAVYYNNRPDENRSYRLTSSRTYFCENSLWYELGYQRLNFDKKKLKGLLQETDRKLRLYFKTGHPLKQDPSNNWADEYIDKVLEADAQAKREASRPKISIRFADLDRIRIDSAQTRDMLLTEEDLPENPADVAGMLKYSPEGSGDPVLKNTYMNQAVTAGTVDSDVQGISDFTSEESDIPLTSENLPEETGIEHNSVFVPEETGTQYNSIFAPNAACTQPVPDIPPDTVNAQQMPDIPLDASHTTLLKALLRGEDVKPAIAQMRGMPEIIADTINEALFDETGDNVVECENGTLAIVEEYRDDLMKIFGGNI